MILEDCVSAVSDVSEGEQPTSWSLELSGVAVAAAE